MITVLPQLASIAPIWQTCTCFGHGDSRDQRTVSSALVSRTVRRTLKVATTFGAGTLRSGLQDLNSNHGPLASTTESHLCHITCFISPHAAEKSIYSDASDPSGGVRLNYSHIYTTSNTTVRVSLHISICAGFGRVGETVLSARKSPAHN